MSRDDAITRGARLARARFNAHAIAIWEAAEWLDNETDVPDTRVGRHAIRLLRDRALRLERGGNQTCCVACGHPIEDGTPRHDLGSDGFAHVGRGACEAAHAKGEQS